MKNKIHMLNSILLVLMFTGVNTLWATDYYVSSSGLDTNNGTSETTPWKTITKANQVLIAGDIVYIKAGTYNSYIAPNNSGTLSKPITYRNYSSDAVTISNTTRGIFLSGKSYITVTGINFYNLDTFMYLQNGANHNIISYCTFNYGRSNSWAGSQIYPNSSYNWIHHCTFSTYGGCDPGHGSGSDSGCLLDIGNDEDGTDTSHYNVVEDSIFYHGGHHLVGLISRYNTLRNNYLHNDAWSNGRGERNLYMAGVTTATGYNLVEGNRFGYSSQTCNDSSPTVGSVAMSTGYNIFRYNNIYHSVAYGLGLYSYYGSGTQYASGSYNKVYNNTIFNSGYNIPQDYAGGEEDSAIYVSTSYTTGNLIKNNLLYEYYNNWKTASAAARQTFANNWSGDTQGDPKFVNASTTPPVDKTDAALPNLSLQSSSPVIDKGGALTTVTSATGSGTSIILADASYFQAGTYGPAGVVKADWIAVGTVTNVVQISSISGNTINLANSISWTNGASVWLYKKSDGVRVLYGAAPDAGAYEFTQAQAPSPPQNLTVISP